MNDGPAKEFKPIPHGRRLALLVAILVLAAGAYYGAQRMGVGFQSLKENRELLMGWRNGHFLPAALVFMAVYCAVVALSLPFGFWLSLTGGFMFGTFHGALFILISATAGASLVFLAARYLFADYCQAYASNLVRKMEAGFQENALSYLLALRLIPLFPFWAVNLGPALLGVSLRIYVLGTFIGIIPGTLVFASLGAGLGTLIEAGEIPDPGVMSNPKIALPLIGLGILALAPIFVKKIKGRATPADAELETTREPNP